MYKQKNISKLRNKAAQLSYALSYDFLQETDNILQNSLRQKQAKWRYKKVGKGKEFMRSLKGFSGSWMHNVLHPWNVKPWTQTGKKQLTKKQWAKFLDSMGKAKGQDLSQYKSSRPMTFPYEIEHAGGEGWFRSGMKNPMAIPGTLGVAGLGNLWGS